MISFKEFANVLTTVLRLFDTPATQTPARLLEARSVGIKDLRYGYVVDEDWMGHGDDALLDDQRTVIPFVAHASYHFIAATMTEDPDHLVGKLVGDLMVRLPSATGQHKEAVRHVAFNKADGVVIGGLSHLGLANHPDVHTHIMRWCTQTP